MTLHVAYCIPTCNPERAADSVRRWRKQGYGVYLAVESDAFPHCSADLITRNPTYAGYSVTCNRLGRQALADGFDLVVFGGDDMWPDPDHRAQQIAAEYLERFPDGYGIMQPTGDVENAPSTPFICGSPWVGRGWIERGYGGLGPFWPEYRQFYMDEELKLVAERLGILWQRLDLCQHHDHWIWPGGPPKTDYQEANDRHFKPDGDIFRRRKAAGFPSALETRAA